VWQGQDPLQAPAEVRAGAAREGSGALGRALGALLPAGHARGAGGSSPLEPGPAGAALGVSPELGRGRGRRRSPSGTGTSGLWAEQGKAELLLCVLPFPLLPSPLPCPSVRLVSFPGVLPW